ncbi:MAG: MFS transporter [Pseudomonadota bacterium]|nr:MFS transporter [Pseudomonadota bacterium]
MIKSPFYIVPIMCFAEVLTMLGVFIFPALMPEFISRWGLSNTEAGWIAGILLAGYAISVPVLVSLTDRIDARLIYISGTTVTAISLFGFAYLASGFWSALLFRMLAGIGLASTYMPGLRVLVDRYGGAKQARALAFYTASFSLGTGVSFYFSGEINSLYGWIVTHKIAGFGALVSALFVILFTHKIVPQKPDVRTGILDFRPVIRNREAMGYILAYGVHSWELFGTRSWLVAFLVYCLSVQNVYETHMAPTMVVSFSAIIAMFASIGGNEIADRYGRRRVVMVFLITSGTLAFMIGFTAGLPYWFIVLVVLLYGGLIQLDSASLTAGSLQAAEKGRRGATLGVHALIGFGGGAIGPLVVGLVLDFSGGGTSTVSWGLAFGSMGLIAFLGPIALWKLRGL